MMMFLMWLFPLLAVALMVYLAGGERATGLFRLVPVRICANCHGTVQNDWQVCPHCGQTLS